MFKWLNTTPDPTAMAGDPRRAWQEARMLFDQLHQQAKHAHWTGRLTGHTATLLPLAELEAQGAVAASRLPAIRTIPLAQIRGSEGRLTDFDAHFRPRHQEFRYRWMRVAQGYFLNRPLPPIDVIQVCDTYYVRDGHHRVSVALALGQTDIEAWVTVWQIPAARAPRSLHPALDCGAPVAA